MFRWFIILSSVFIALLVVLLLSIFHPELINANWIIGFLIPIAKYLFHPVLVAGIGAMLIGGFVGAIELIGRYRDEPFIALTASGSYLYIVINALLSLLAFVGLLIYKPEYLDAKDLLKNMIEAAALAGFGSLIIMRTAIARTQIGGKDVSVGPAFFIDTLLKAADRSVDRFQAINRLGNVSDAMLGGTQPDKHVSENILELSTEDLVAICANSLQNLEAEERENLDQKIGKIAELSNKNVSKEVIRYLSGLQLQQVIGNDAFFQACEVMKKIVKMPTPDAKLTEQDDKIDEMFSKRQEPGTGSSNG